MVMAMIGYLLIFLVGMFVGFVLTRRYEQLSKQREKGVPGSYHYRRARA